MPPSAPVSPPPALAAGAGLRDAALAEALARREESEAVAQVARGLAGATMRLPEALRLLADHTAALLSADGAAIALTAEGGGFDVHAAIGRLLPLAGRTIEPGRLPLSSAAVATRGVSLSDDLPAEAGVDRQMAEQLGIRHLLVAPMIVENEAVGVLIAAQGENGHFAGTDGALLQRLADHGAVAVRNGELFRRAERSAREARALQEIVGRINQSLELDRVFALIARHAAELLNARGARLGMVEGSEFVIVGSAGLADVQLGARMPLEEALCAGCLRSKRPERIAGPAGPPDRWPWSEKLMPPERSGALAVPLLVGGREIGAISVVGKESGDFDDRDAELLLALANHAAVAIENGRLYRASVRTMRHASILATAARSLTQNVTPGATYADIARIARSSLSADGVAIYLADPSTGVVELPFSDGAGAQLTPVILENFWETAGGAAVRGGVAFFRSDIHEHGDERVMQVLEDDGIRSVAILPLIVEGRARGLLVIRHRVPKAFDEEQQRLLLDFAMHVAAAMRNAMLFAGLERRAARLRAVAQVQQAISAARSLADIYGEIYKAVASVVDSPCFTLLGYDEAEGVFIPEYVVDAGAPVPTEGLPRLPLADGMTSQAFRMREPNITACSQRGWTGHVHTTASESRVAVVLTAPILHSGEALGVLQAQSYRHDAYGWDDFDLVMHIARQAGTAIARARAFEAEQREREQAEAAAEIARIALRARSVDAAAMDLLAVIDRVVPSEGSALIVIGPENAPRVVAARGLSAHRLRRAPRATPINLRAVSPDARPRPTTRPAVESHAAATDDDRASATVIPLASGDRSIGALEVTLARRPEPAARDVASLRRLAAPIALALHTLLMREEERRQEERQRVMGTALDSLEQPVFVFDPDATIRYANEAAVREYQYGLAELSGMRARRLTVTPVGQPEQPGPLEEALATMLPGEQLHLRRDGSEFPASVTFSAVHDASGQCTGVVAIVRNLAEERRLAEQLRQSERLAALGELIAGVAHEVNNPLAGISAMTQILQEEALTPDQRDSVGLIRREADRAVAVIRDLLTFARKSGPRVVSVDLNEIVEQTLRLRSYALRTTGIEVDLALEPDLWPVQGDDRQLQQVLLNLLVNAEHALQTVSRKHVTIRTGNQFDRVVLEVTDSGVGIPAAAQKRIFEPFFTTKPEGRGTGLGLSVSYGIVQTHGGTLSVHSAPGAGATFRIALPAAAEVVALTQTSTLP